VDENESDFSRNLEGAPESRESGENFLRSRHTIYRGGGGYFQERVSIRPLRDLWRTRVHSDVPRVTFFNREFVGFRGNGSSESTRFPEGLVLGNSVKPCHPRKVGFPKFMERVREAAL
jgi:hypothetical protein